MTEQKYDIIKLNSKKGTERVEIALLKNGLPDAVITVDETWIDACFSAFINAFGIEKVEDAFEFAKDDFSEEGD